MTETQQPVSDDVFSIQQKWYAINTLSGQEGRVKQTLEDRIKELKLDAKFGSILIPTERFEDVRTQIKAGKTVTSKRVLQRKVAPGYIFVQMELTPDTFQCVKGTPKVLGFVGASKSRTSSDVELRRIPAVPEKQIKAMTALLVEEERAPKIDFSVGDAVKIIGGNFINFSGDVTEIHPHKVKVMLTIFGRATPVELELTQVKRA